MKVAIATVLLCLTSVAANAQYYTTTPNPYIGGWTTTGPNYNATTTPNAFGGGYNTTVIAPPPPGSGHGSSFGGPAYSNNPYGSSYRR